MSTLLNGTSISSEFPSVALPGDLSDAISEAVTTPPDAPSRSAAICSLVREVYESVSWLHGVDAPPNDELTSLYQVLVGADAHHARMQSASGAQDDVCEATS